MGFEESDLVLDSSNFDALLGSAVATSAAPICLYVLLLL